MSEPIIQVKSLSKVYDISHEVNVDRNSMQETIMRILRKPLELLTGKKMSHEKFWALKDVSFEVEKGDVVGIIGRNGSGKSTLLKTLSRIIEPTKGEAVLHGSTASLLEVGTGFHPELSGRENIYFNGSILGMNRKEIQAKFKEIVEFSGVEQFLDTPVKFYSSGMYVRLAFAVAAHLEPDILIVDEVLAVGDAEFQKKSLGKMRDVTKNKGRTVMFVSHSMDAIKSICNKVIWMQDGVLKAYGDTDEVVSQYLDSTHRNEVEISKRKDRRGSGVLKFSGINSDISSLEKGIINISLQVNSERDILDPLFSIVITDERGHPLSNLINKITNDKVHISKGANRIKLTLEDFSLVPGRYSISVFASSDIHNSEIYDWVQEAATLTIPEYDYYKTGEAPNIRGEALYMDYKFSNEK